MKRDDNMLVNEVERLKYLNEELATRNVNLRHELQDSNNLMTTIMGLNLQLQWEKRCYVEQLRHMQRRRRGHARMTA